MYVCMGVCVYEWSSDSPSRVIILTIIHSFTHRLHPFASCIHLLCGRSFPFSFVDLLLYLCHYWQAIVILCVSTAGFALQKPQQRAESIHSRHVYPVLTHAGPASYAIYTPIKHNTPHITHARPPRHTSI